jgi:prepilin-type processing-associated H-X9-DG protein
MIGRRKRKRRGIMGFTITELATVAAVVSVIPAGAYMKAKEKALQTTCTNNLRQVGQMCQMHLMAEDDTWPNATFYPADINADNSIYKILKQQGDVSRIMTCPSLPDQLQQKQLTFVYNDDMAGQRNVENLEKKWILTEFTCVSSIAPPAHPNGWNYLFGDGHVATHNFLPKKITDARASVERPQ